MTVIMSQFGESSLISDEGGAEKKNLRGFIRSGHCKDAYGFMLDSQVFFPDFSKVTHAKRVAMMFSFYGFIFGGIHLIGKHQLAEEYVNGFVNSEVIA